MVKATRLTSEGNQLDTGGTGAALEVAVRNALRPLVLQAGLERVPDMPTERVAVYAEVITKLASRAPPDASAAAAHAAAAQQDAAAVASAVEPAARMLLALDARSQELGLSMFSSAVLVKLHGRATELQVGDASVAKSAATAVEEHTKNDELKAAGDALMRIAEETPAGKKWMASLKKTGLWSSTVERVAAASQTGDMSLEKAAR